MLLDLEFLWHLCMVLGVPASSQPPTQWRIQIARSLKVSAGSKEHSRHSPLNVITCTCRCRDKFFGRPGYLKNGVPSAKLSNLVPANNQSEKHLAFMVWTLETRVSVWKKAADLTTHKTERCELAWLEPKKQVQHGCPSGKIPEMRCKNSPQNWWTLRCSTPPTRIPDLK